MSRSSLYEPLAPTSSALPKQMVAAVVKAGGRIDFCDLPIPVPKPNGVRIRVEGCGVCTTHTPVWNGTIQRAFAPGAPGREAWGVVDAVGSAVTHLEPGQRVAFFARHGYAQYDIADAAFVFPLPNSLEGQPFPTEPLTTAVNIFRRTAISPGDYVAILGIGFVGALLTQLATLAQARVIAIDDRLCPLRFARQLGAEQTLAIHASMDRHDVIRTVRDMVGGWLCDIVIEATGTQASLDLAAELTRERGRLVVAGCQHDGVRTVDMRLWNWRGMDIINAHDRSPALFQEGLREAIAAVETGLLTPAPLYTHRFPLERLGEALSLAAERPEGFMKALIDID